MGMVAFFPWFTLDTPRTPAEGDDFDDIGTFFYAAITRR